MAEAAYKMSTEEESIAQQIIKMYERLRGKRGNWESHWQEIAERVWPNHSQLFQGRKNNGTDGTKRNEFVFDATAAQALDRFSAILDSLLTPRNSTWHQLKPDNALLEKDRQTKLWFEQANRALFRARYSPTAGFSGQNQLGWKSVGAFGSGCLFTDTLRSGPPGVGKGFRYKQVHQSEVFFVENHQGIVDSVLRYFSMSVRQIAKAWPKTCPSVVSQKMTTNPDEEFDIIHCVMPREDYDPKRADFKGMYWAGFYVFVQQKCFLEEGGYRTFPYSVPRYEQVPGETYGRSPAMLVLPAVKTLNEMKKTVLKQGHKALDPVLLAADDGVVDTFSLRPGALNAGGVSADGRPLVQALPVGNIVAGKELMDDERADIKDAFLVSLFQILAENPRMTATEVIERTKEKGFLLAPALGRIQDESLGPQIERELDLAMGLGLLPPLPPALVEAKGEYRIIYDSPLTRAMRAEEASGMMRTFETALNYATAAQDPTALDHFNLDIIIPELAEINGVPTSWMRGQNDIAAMREQRAKAAQQQAAVEAAPGQAALIGAGAKAEKAGI